MNQVALTWLLLVVTALASGTCLVAVLVSNRVYELPFAFVGIASMVANGYLLISLPRITGAPASLIWGFAISMGAAAGGYALAASLLHLLAGSATPSAPGTAERSSREPVVILTACVEPPSYRARETAAMLQGLSDEGLLDVSLAFLPLLFFAQKARYRVAGDVGPSRRDLERIADKIAVTLPPSISVSWADCGGADSLAAEALRRAHEGHRRIVVAPVALAESWTLREARGDLDDAHLDDLGTAVRYTAPLFDSDRIVAMLTTRVRDATRSASNPAVILVGVGQPEFASHHDSDFDEFEIAFLSRLKMSLLDHGFHESSVVVAWPDWGQPDVTSTVRHLANLDHDVIAVVPAAYPLETLTVKIDLEAAVRQARVDESVRVLLMSAWKDDDAVISELRARIMDALAEDGS